MNKVFQLKDVVNAASDIYREVCKVHFGVRASKNEIPSAQIDMLSDMAANRFRAALYERLEKGTKHNVQI